MLVEDFIYWPNVGVLLYQPHKRWHHRVHTLDRHAFPVVAVSPEQLLS